jgi:hypothetical protein
MVIKTKSIFAYKYFKGIKVPSKRLAQLYENDGTDVFIVTIFKIAWVLVAISDIVFN